MEAWYAIMGIGAVCHTLNPRLFADQLCYIINHAEDRIIFTDLTFLPVLIEHRARMPSVERFIVLTDEGRMKDVALEGALSSESLIERHGPDCAWGGFDEQTACGLCYTSGTTGNPKGVLYSHRSNFLHTLVTLQHDVMGLSVRDTVLAVVPMFHANAWGLAFSCPAVGAKLVMPGPKMDGASILELLETEKVTFSAAVPTVWQMLLAHLKATGARLTTLKRVVIGGSAVPEAIIRAFHDDYGVDVVHAWGMTETSPLGTLSTPTPEIAALSFEDQMPYKLKQGRPPLGVRAEADRRRRRSPAPRRQDLRPAEGQGAVHRRRVFQGRRRRYPRRRGLLRHRRRGHHRPGRLHADHRPGQGRDQVRRRVDQLHRDREHRRRPSQGRCWRR